MAKKDEAPEGRRGRYVGQNGRAFPGPAGVSLSCFTGEMYDVPQDFSYLWTNPDYEGLFEWEGSKK